MKINCGILMFFTALFFSSTTLVCPPVIPIPMFGCFANRPEAQAKYQESLATANEFASSLSEPLITILGEARITAIQAAKDIKPNATLFFEQRDQLEQMIAKALLTVSPEDALALAKYADAVAKVDSLTFDGCADSPHIKGSSMCKVNIYQYCYLIKEALKQAVKFHSEGNIESFKERVAQVIALATHGVAQFTSLYYSIVTAFELATRQAEGTTDPLTPANEAFRLAPFATARCRFLHVYRSGPIEERVPERVLCCSCQTVCNGNQDVQHNLFSEEVQIGLPFECVETTGHDLLQHAICSDCFLGMTKRSSSDMIKCRKCGAGLAQ